jgi:hypothetical protein
MRLKIIVNVTDELQKPKQVTPMNPHKEKKLKIENIDNRL